MSSIALYHKKKTDKKYWLQYINVDTWANIITEEEVRDNDTNIRTLI